MIFSHMAFSILKLCIDLWILAMVLYSPLSEVNLKYINGASLLTLAKD